MRRVSTIIPVTRVARVLRVLEASKVTSQKNERDCLQAENLGRVARPVILEMRGAKMLVTFAIFLHFLLLPLASDLRVDSET